jgi:uncharacterized protein YecT (DUF1311 family)
MRKGLLISLLLAGAVAHAASFDCSKAKTPQEKAICASPELSAADDQLAAAYKVWLAAVPAEIVPEVREDQRGWLRRLAANCTSEEAESTTALAGCMMNQYPSRIKELRAKVLTLGGVTFYWRSITRKEPDEVGDVGDVASERNVDEVNPGFGTLSAEWPQSTSAIAEWKAWNTAVESATQGMTDEGVKDGSGNVKTKWTATAGIDAQVTTSLGVVSADLVTATIEDFWDGHGAHPNTNSIQFNWLLKQNRELQAKDVFRAGSGWEQFLQKRCDKYLHEQLDQDGQSYETFEQPGEMAKTLHGIVVEPVNWQLDGKGLTIVFQDYAVACHACKPPPVTTSWSDLQPYLQTSFVRPK